jgi:putative ABC transport system substrate-binding protein
MNRRTFFGALAGSLVAAPRVARTQQAGKVHRIGALTGTVGLDGLRQGLRDLGYREGQNFVIEHRDVEGRFERLSPAARELVRLGVDVIVAGGSESVAAARAASGSLPIVMTTVGDPVAQGFIKSLSKPGGNITGLVNFVNEITGKWLELLREVDPSLVRVAVLWNPPQPAHRGLLKEMEAAAISRGLQLHPLAVRTADELEPALVSAQRGGATGLTMLGSVIHFRNLRRIADFARQSRLLTVSWTSEFVTLGGLMAYGASTIDQYRRAAAYVDKILKGARPAELPVEGPTRLELILNARTAKALGIVIPQSLLLRADQVIE